MENSGKDENSSKRKHPADQQQLNDFLSDMQYTPAPAPVHYNNQQ